jgi:hypothetical protein
MQRKIQTKNKLVYGVGINDADYIVQFYSNSNQDGTAKILSCPYYRRWRGILARCYRKHKQPTYAGCSVVHEWKYFSNFKRWVDEQPNRNWQNCDLDKDLLIGGNRLYGPETVVFVSEQVNQFLKGHTKPSKYLTGANYSKSYNTFKSRCSDPFKIKPRSVGTFKTEMEAHKAWQNKKHEYACMLADLQEDPRVAQALRERYAPDKDWTNK